MEGIFFLNTIAKSIMGKVCRSVDVRNSPEQISEFSDCRIVEGHLQVVLMENVDNPSHYIGHTFKELYEITDYLLLFRLRNLTSLDLIFPKLSVIGGKQLIKGFSLIVFDLPQLEEVNLESLRRIDRGGVIVESCPKVCYVDTVNWKALGASHANVSDDMTSSRCENKTCVNECGFCWNNLQCQNVSRSSCHQACVGCFKSNSIRHCMACKYFNDSGSCVEKCPQSKVTDNQTGRCLSSEECVSKPDERSIYNGSCVASCPQNYERNEKGNCISSNKTWCPGIKITYALDLEKLVDCTHIRGSLEVEMSDENFGFNKLAQCLGKIEFISEYLKIVRSKYVRSLKFFKSLRTIGGEKLWSRYYAFYVVQNQNLQELWTCDNFSLIIEQGEVLFQDNPHLCTSKIYWLTNRTMILPNDSKLIHVYKNGDQTVCNKTKMNISVVETNAYNVTITLAKPETSEDNKFVGYIVYYVEDTVIEHDDLMKDHCEIGWYSIFTRNTTIQLLDLTPYTRYGYFVKIQKTLAQIQETPISFFTTASCEPSGPIEFEASSSTDYSITLKWTRPNVVHKALTHYSLAVYQQNDYIPMIRQRNYCRHPICSCPKPIEFKIFQKDQFCMSEAGTCLHGKYMADTNKIVKRSADLDEDCVQDLKINGNDSTYEVPKLHHFTLYVFFLKACENENCSEPEMTWLRTQKKKEADVVSHVKLTTVSDRVSVFWMEPNEISGAILAYNIEYKKRDAQVSVVECVPFQRQNQSKNWKYDIVGLDHGRYVVRVGAVSLAGAETMSSWKSFQIGHTETTESVGMYVVPTVVAILILGLITLVIRRRYKQAQQSDTEQLLNRHDAFEDESLDEQDDQWTLDSETVEIMKQLQQDSLTIAFHR